MKRWVCGRLIGGKDGMGFGISWVDVDLGSASSVLNHPMNIYSTKLLFT